MRGRKHLTLEEQMAKVIQDIENTKNTLTELEAKKKELQKKINKEQIMELQELMKKNNLTIDDVRALIEKK